MSNTQHIRTALVSIAVIVAALVVWFIFSQIWDGAERVLSVLGSVSSAFTGYALAMSSYLEQRWSPDQVVPTVLLRDAIATTSAAGNAATYFAREIGSWQRHSLATADSVHFAPVAVPTAQVAKVEQGIKMLQKELQKYIPEEFARLHGTRAAMEHIIRDLAPQNNLGSQGKRSRTTEQPALSQKEKKYRRVVEQHLKELLKLVAKTSNHRNRVGVKGEEIRILAWSAERNLGGLQGDVETLKRAVEERPIDTGGNEGHSGIATTQEKEELISRIEELNREVWLQRAEMKARKSRAEKFAIACYFELEILRYLQDDVNFLSGRVAHGEVGVRGAAKRMLNVVNILIKSIEEGYLRHPY